MFLDFVLAHMGECFRIYPGAPGKGCKYFCNKDVTKLLLSQSRPYFTFIDASTTYSPDLEQHFVYLLL